MASLFSRIHLKSRLARHAGAPGSEIPEVAGGEAAEVVSTATAAAAATVPRGLHETFLHVCRTPWILLSELLEELQMWAILVVQRPVKDLDWRSEKEW